LEERFAVENLDFYEAVERLKFLAIKSDEWLSHSFNIYNTHIKIGGAAEVNVSGELRSKFEAQMQEGVVSEALFEEAQHEIVMMVRDGPFHAFTKTKEFDDILHARESAVGAIAGQIPGGLILTVIFETYFLPLVSRRYDDNLKEGRPQLRSKLRQLLHK